jgi:hypothetical protein
VVDLILAAGQGSNVRQPVDRLILALATDQRLVMLTEVQSHTAPDPAKVLFADPALDKDRGHGLPEVERIFGTGSGGVETALITVAEAEFEIVG